MTVMPVFESHRALAREKRLFLLAASALFIYALMVPMGWATETSEKIIAIRFVGNKITRDSVLRQQLTIHVGQPFNAAQVAASRQAIMNLGLFSSVSDSVKHTPKGVIITFIVHEKIYTWGYPLLSRDINGNISYGGQIQSDNLFGLDQTLKLVIKRNRPTNGGDQLQETLSYLAPRISGSPYNIDTNLTQTSQPQLSLGEGGDQGDYSQRTRSLGVTISRWLFRQGPSTGWSGSLGWSLSATHYQWLSGTKGLAQNSRSSGFSVGASYTDVDLHAYSYRSGEAFGTSFGFGATRRVRTYPQLSLSAYLRRYRRLSTPLTNLNYRLQAGVAWQSSALGPAYSLGGGNSLRGYQSGSIEGDAFFLANVEYLRPIFNQTRVRGVVFMDAGNAWPLQAIRPWNLYSDIGLGLRIAIPWLVKVDLRMDCAYAVGQRRYRCYFGTHNMF